MKAFCLAGSSYRLGLAMFQTMQQRNQPGTALVDNLERVFDPRSDHPGRPRQGVADPGLQLVLLLQGQLAGATPVVESGQAIDPVFLEKPVPRPDRIVIDQQHPTNILAAHPAVQQHQRVRTPGQTMLDRPVPSQIGQVLPFL